MPKITYLLPTGDVSFDIAHSAEEISFNGKRMEAGFGPLADPLGQRAVVDPPAPPKQESGAQMQQGAEQGAAWLAGTPQQPGLYAVLTIIRGPSYAVFHGEEGMWSGYESLPYWTAERVAKATKGTKATTWRGWRALNADEQAEYERLA